MRYVYKKLLYLAFLLISGLCWQGCNVINPPEQTPTYIHIDSFHFVGNPLIHTTTSHQITHVWAYYNNSPVGAFDLPCTFPIITKGDMGKLELAPGIAVNGLNSDLGEYPFYSIDTSSFRASPGKVINYQPKSEFFSSVKIHTISDFEGGVVRFVLWGGTIPMTVTSDDSLVYEGNYSGSILLTAPSDTSSIDSTATAFAIPAGTAFIEFDYKSDMQFYVGLQANQGSLISTNVSYQAGINPSDHWQKFYLNVANFAAQYQATTYNLYIKTSLPANKTRGRLLLDNIQLVTF